MIRVACPSCQKVHDFLDLYRGLTIFCKYCRAGVLVPKDAESTTASADAFMALPKSIPIEKQRGPIERDQHLVRAESLPQESLSENLIDDAAAPTSGVKPDESSRAGGRKRALVLMAFFVLVLVVGGFFVARSLIQKRLVETEPRTQRS